MTLPFTSRTLPAERLKESPFFFLQGASHVIVTALSSLQKEPGNSRVKIALFPPPLSFWRGFFCRRGCAVLFPPAAGCGSLLLRGRQFRKALIFSFLGRIVKSPLNVQGFPPEKKDLQLPPSFYQFSSFFQTGS